MYIIGRNALALTNAAHALNPTHSALPHTCRTTAPAPIQLNRINHSHQQSVKQPPSQANQAISHDQSISQSINTQPQQSFNHSHHTIQPHLYLSHINSNDLSFSANHSFSLAASHSVNSHCYCTCTFSHSREMHTSHNNIAHSNLWLTGYTLTEFCMLLCLIPSVTLQVSLNLLR